MYIILGSTIHSSLFATETHHLHNFQLVQGFLYTSVMASLHSSRPLGNLEIFFKKLADLGAPLEREHWAVHLALQLRVTDNVNLLPYLQKTWQAVRHQIPAISSIIIPAQEPGAESKSSTLEREVLAIPAFDADLWSKETFFVHDTETGGDSLFCALRPSSSATCHWLPQSSELVIRTSHWRLDGIGLSKLGHVFLTILADMLPMNAKNVPSVAPMLHKAFIQPLPPSIEEVARIWRKTRGSKAEEVS